MVLVSVDEDPQILPAQQRAVYDVTGAGDIVLAMLGLGLGSRLSMGESARLANFTAGLEVEKLGAVAIGMAEIRARLQSQRFAQGIFPLEELAEVLNERRRRGEKIALTNGCFDLLHVGHVRYLQEAAGAGDVLVVGVNSDASVRRLKGDGRPVISQQDRAAMIAALGCVDYVLVFDEDTPHRMLERLQPDVLVKGGNYAGKRDVVGHELVEAYGGAIHLTSFINGVSTTTLMEAISDEDRRSPLRILTDSASS